MKQYCLVCETEMTAGNNWCPETDCPAEKSPWILEPGENLGDIKIVRLVIILRHAVLYEASHHDEPVLLKVSHAGAWNRDRLKREAAVFARLSTEAKPPIALARLRPPYLHTDIQQAPHGKITLRGQLLYYILLDPFTGGSLRDLLSQTPQLWVQQVGQILLMLSEAAAFLHQHHAYHFMLSPEVVLLRIDEKSPYAPRLLLFDLGLATADPALHWHAPAAFPAYIDPALLKDQPSFIPHATDTYGLGLILQEMLDGNPTYARKLHSDSSIYRLIRHGRHQIKPRYDVLHLPRLAAGLLASEPKERTPNKPIAVFHQLAQDFPAVPPEKRSWRPDPQRVRRVMAIIIAVIIIAIIALSLPPS